MNDELVARIERSPTHTIDDHKCSSSEFLEWAGRSFRPATYARVQNEFIRDWMLKLSKTAIEVYLILCEMSSNGEGICWPSVEYLSKQLGISERHVRRATSELQRHGLIQKGRYHDRETNRQHNIYKIKLLGPERVRPEEDLEEILTIPFDD
jgi:predicted transcriptional regulator